MLDTNVLISGIFWQGSPHQILRAWDENRFTVIGSKEIVDEYLRVLRRIDTRSDIAERWTAYITSKIHLVKVGKIMKLSRDSTDDKFIATAIMGNADYIVSGDNDLLLLPNISPVRIINPSAFLSKFNNQKDL